MGRDAHPDVLRCREAHLEIREGSAGLLGGPGLACRCTWRFGRGRESYPEVRKRLDGLGSPTEGSGGVRRPTRRFLRVREAHLEIWYGSGGPLGGPGGEGRCTQRSRRGGEAHREVREG